MTFRSIPYALVSCLALVLTTILSRGSSAQKKPPTAGRGRGVDTVQAAGSIEGDVYLVMKSGDTKKGAGRTIYLVRDSDSLHQRLLRICAEPAPVDSIDRRAAVLHDSALAAIRARNPQLMKQLAIRERATVLSRDSVKIRRIAAFRLEVLAAAVDSVGTGMNAHYRFSRVSPGKFILFAEWTIADNAYQWWSPIVLAAGQSMTRDLDNSSEANNNLYCGIG